MADPLSIAASIVGILSAAGKVYDVLSTFISSTVDAPSSAAFTLETVEAMKVTVSAVQHLVETSHTLPSSRKGLIQLDHLSAVITHSVLTVAELESILCKDDEAIFRIRWAWNEKKVLGLLPRLESQKSSLALMVAIFKSESEADARSCQDKLLAKMDDVIAQNQALAHRLQDLEDKFDLRTPSIKVLDDRASTIITRRFSKQSLSSVASSTLDSARRHSAAVASRFSVVSRSDFEFALEKSRVYTRTQARLSDISFTSSTAPTNTWSMLSGLSLNDISIVSAFRLPLTAEDIQRFAPGSTLSAVTNNQPASPEWPLNSLRITSPAKSPSRPDQTNERNWTQEKLDLLNIHLDKTYSKTPKTLSIKVVLVGDITALKSKFLRTYVNPDGLISESYMSGVHESFGIIARIGNMILNIALHDTTGQEDYQSLRRLSYAGTDVFLVLSHAIFGDDLESAKTIWIPEISQHCPHTPYVIVETYDQVVGAPIGGTLQKPDSMLVSQKVAKETGASKCIMCDVTDPKNVRLVFAQAILSVLRGRK